MAVLSIGQLLDRRYRIVEVLTSGAFGQTYVAADMRRPGYPQCIVRQFSFPSRNPKALQVVQLLFKKKAETLEKLGTHERIPQLLACFEEEGQLYFVEEYILGHPLAQELLPGQKLSDEYVIRLLQDLLEVLDFIHKNGVIHRNICPDNLIRRQSDGRLVPINFGLVQEIANPSARAQNAAPPSQAPEVLAYMAPEQLQGNPLYNSDLYSVGTICVQALTGAKASQLPRHGETNGSKPPSSQWRKEAEAVEPSLADFIDRLICPFFDQRYQSAAEALQDLRTLYGLGSGVGSGAGLSGAGRYGRGLSAQKNGAGAGKLAKAEGAGDDRGGWRSRLVAYGQRMWKEDRRRVLVVGAAAIAAVALVGLGARPLQIQWHLHRGTVALEAGNYQGAMAAFQAAAAIDGAHPEVLYRRGVAYIDAGDFEAAIADLDRAIRARPNRAPAYFQRGNARYYLGDLDGALADYSEALKRDDSLAAVYLNRGNVKADTGDDAGAIADYDRAIAAAKPTDPALAAAYLNRSLSHSNLDQQQQAIDDATKAIELNPSYAMAYQNRALAHRRLGNFQAAIADLNVAIQLDPNDPDPYYNRGLSRYDLGEIQGTIEDFNRAIELRPNHALVYYDRGVARLTQRDRSGALLDFKQSAKLCLDQGRLGCYRDAQYQIQQLEAGRTVARPQLLDDRIRQAEGDEPDEGDGSETDTSGDTTDG
jgi:tetratricopeptide (TPR) repeat protein